MFLKRIELHGFKSFADKVQVEFQQGITGIVGPNGCGKSNISDAVRWVLGEQSVKSLRGSNMSDVIFAGSQDRKAQNVAEVTLVFDNHSRFMKLDYEEIEITRRLYRQNNEAEYLMNKQPCRLKDIVDLLIDTGLGRDSLSIISQGNISSFADSKPDERRGLFEEAAGVAKYKKRKLESIRKLGRTKENLERIGDIVYELEKQIGPLKRQKEKAETFVALKEQLTSIEVTVLVKEIGEAKASLDSLRTIIKDVNDRYASVEAEVLLKESNNEDVKKKMYTLDQEINILQTNLMDAMTSVSDLEAAKVETDQKRKYILENQSKENLDAKIEQLREMLKDVLQEYNNRVERLQQTKEEVDMILHTQDSKNRQLQSLKDEMEMVSSQINKQKSRKEMLVDAVENKTNLHNGVKAVVSLSKSNPGIIGVIEDLISPRNNYEIAITTALGAALQFVITKDDEQAREAIRFLRNNKAGRATFLPLNVMKPRSLRDEHYLVCKEMEGFLGVASDFVQYPKHISDAILNQLGNVIISDTLENANIISKATFSRYKVVCLEGDVVNVGGSMSGGSQQQQRSTLLQKTELEAVSIDLDKLEKKLVETRNQYNRLDNEIKEAAHEILQKQMSYAKLEVVVQGKKEELISAKSEYESLSDQSVELEKFASGSAESRLVNELNEAIQNRDKLTEQIKAKRELRMQYVNENDTNDTALRTLRSDLKVLQQDVTKHSIEATKIESLLNTHLTRLNEEYRMTYEYAVEQFIEEINLTEAKEQVLSLRNKITSLGNVNLDAIEEYKVISERYESMDNQRIDLLQAQDSILKAIEEMDEIMITKFSTTFEKIKVEFNTVFRNLFGGGKADIRYTDPDNILETGIDIDVQPPGKAVQNISLFSGGEKALIAISCLFAILRVRPVPMCILDEVEAALDMANVDRFAKYLKEFSESSQFIVVTHREGTMEVCDLLYGATMQQKGVTKLVSVKLEEAIDLTEAS